MAVALALAAYMRGDQPSLSWMSRSGVASEKYSKAYEEDKQTQMIDCLDEL